MRAVQEWYNSGKEYGPSYRDLVSLSGLPIGTVYKTCSYLKEQGSINYEINVARSIRINNSKGVNANE
jgi:hypothetical protein